MAKQPGTRFPVPTWWDVLKVGISIVLGAVSYWQSQTISEEIHRLRDLFLKYEKGREGVRKPPDKSVSFPNQYFRGDRS